MSKITGRHDDLHIGAIVFLTFVISLSALFVVPRAPQVAQTMWIVAMCLLAVGAAIFDYGE